MRLGRFSFSALLLLCAVASGPAMSRVVQPPQNLRVTDLPGDNGGVVQILFDRSADDGIGYNDVTEYRIYDQMSNGNYRLFKTLAATDALSYKWQKSGLPLGATFTVRVAAFNGIAESSYVTASGSAMDNTAPAPPSNARLDSPSDDADDTMRLIWNRSVDDSATGDVIDYWLYVNINGAWPTAGRVTATGAGTYTYTFRDLTPGVQYGFRIRAWDGTNFSSMVSLSGDTLPPAPPRNLRIVDMPGDNGGAVQILFDRSADDGTGADDVTEYRIYDQMSNGNYRLFKTLAATNASSYKWQKSGLPLGATFRVRVAAFDGLQESDYATASGVAVDNMAPGPPRNVKLENPADDAGDTMRLTWTRSLNDSATGDVVDYWLYVNINGTWPVAGRVPATGAATYTYTFQNLTPGAPYGFRIRAWDGTNFSSMVSVSGDSLPPGPPQNLRVVDVPGDNGGVVQVLFNRSADDGIGADDVTEYRVYNRTATGSYALVKTIPATNAASYAWTWSGLARGAAINLRVAAFDGFQQSVYATASGVAADNMAPGPPRNVKLENPADDAGDTMRLTWTRSVNDWPTGDVVNYWLYVNINGTWPIAAKVAATASETYSYTFRNLTPGTRYGFRIRAWDGVNFSEMVSVSGDSLPPGPPQNLRVVDVPGDNGGVVQVLFNRSADDGIGADDVVEYRVYNRTATGSYPLVKTIPATNAASYAWIWSGLARGAAINLRVAAFDGFQQSVYATASGVAADNMAPGPPRNVKLENPADDAGDTMRLTWTRSVNDWPTGDVVNYWLYVNINGTWPVAAKVAANASETYSYTFRNLTPGTRYGFRIRAWDGANFSEMVSVSGDSLPPGPPQNLRVVDVPGDDGGVVQVLFDRSADDGIGADDVTEYRIYQPTSTGAYNRLATIPATNALSYSWKKTGLPAGTSLSVRVAAFDGFQQSVYAMASGSALDNTPPRPALSLTVTDYPDDDGTSLLVKFNASPDDTTADPETTRYDVYRATSATGAGTLVKAVTATRAATYQFRNGYLTAGTTYWYWVVSVGSAGKSATARVAAKPLDDRPVAPPTNLTAVDHPYDNGGVIDLRWGRSADDGTGNDSVVKYFIYRRMANVQTPPDRIATVNATNATTYAWSDTTAPRELVIYEYTVTASSASRESAPTAAARAFWENNNVLAFYAPSGLTARDRASDAGGCITLTWTRSTSEGDLGPPPPPPGGLTSSAVETQGGYGGQYEFYRRTANGTYGSQPTFLVDAAGTTNPMTYDNTGLTNGTRYYYKVRFRRYSQISPFTAEASAIPIVGGTGTASAGADEVAPAESEAPSASAPAGASVVSLAGAPSQCVVGQNLTVTSEVRWQGAATTYLEFTVNGGSIMRTAAKSGRDAFSAAFTLPSGSLPVGTVLQVRAIATDGTAIAWSGTSTVTIVAP